MVLGRVVRTGLKASDAKERLHQQERRAKRHARMQMLRANGVVGDPSEQPESPVEHEQRVAKIQAAAERRETAITKNKRSQVWKIIGGVIFILVIIAFKILHRMM
jgi:hypothetical protein